MRQPTIRPGGEQDGDRQDACRTELREVVTEQVRGAATPERPEAVDHALGEIGRDRRRRPHEAEREALDEDAADRGTRGSCCRHADRAAEHVGEQQHEHQRLDRDVEQLLGDLADVLHVATGVDQGVDSQTCSEAGRVVAASGPTGGSGSARASAASMRVVACRWRYGSSSVSLSASGRAVSERKTSSSVADGG